jgi:FeS assembly SUF system protein
MSATEATDDIDLELEAEPPATELPTGHPKLREVKDALREIFDPEIPVNIYELGLIYKIDIDVENNVAIRMTLTAPACPVAGEMPGQVKEALETIDGIGNVDVELVWDPPWNPSLMAETAKLQLGMF